MKKSCIWTSTEIMKKKNPLHSSGNTCNYPFIKKSFVCFQGRSFANAITQSMLCYIMAGVSEWNKLFISLSSLRLPYLFKCFYLDLGSSSMDSPLVLGTIMEWRKSRESRLYQTSETFTTKLFFFCFTFYATCPVWIGGNSASCFLTLGPGLMRCDLSS